MIDLEATRQREQLAFMASGAELEYRGARPAQPGADELIAAFETDQGHGPGSSGRVVSQHDGLTAVVDCVEIAGRRWAVKRARTESLVRNVDGATAFLNEIQRRIDFERCRSQPGARAAWSGVIGTAYASFRRGIIISPWIEGVAVHAWSERAIEQVLTTATVLAGAGYFEWDLSPGNVLDDGQQAWLFDFGYTYPYDPLRQFNSAGSGTSAPQFHPAERFETRSYFAALLALEADSQPQALAAYRLEKEIALTVYGRWRAGLAQRGARPHVLEWIDTITARWTDALRGDADALYLAEAWRSHALDVEDDLHGRSCTPGTLARLDWLLDRLRDALPALQRHAALVGADAARSPQDLRALYAGKRAQAEAWQLR